MEGPYLCMRRLLFVYIAAHGSSDTPINFNDRSFKKLRLYKIVVLFFKYIWNRLYIDVQLCFRRFPIDGFSGKWWSK